MKILIIRFSSLGDLVTLEPVFRAARLFYRNANITFLSSSIGVSLYENTSYFNKFVKHEGVMSSVAKLKENFDLVLNLQCNKPSHLVSMLIRRKLVLNKSYSFFQKTFGLKHEHQTWKEFFAKAGIDERTQNQYWSQADSEVIRLPVSRDRSFFINKIKPIIAISTGASPRWISKRWGVQNYSLLAKKLLDRGFVVVLVGSLYEKDDAYLIKSENPCVKDFVANTNLGQLKDLLSEVDVFVGNDSGPAHIAAGVGVCTVTIFGSTSIKHCVASMNYMGDHHCLKPSKKIICHPCYKSKCPTKHECMLDIKVESVLQAVLNLVEKKSS